VPDAVTDVALRAALDEDENFRTFLDRLGALFGEEHRPGPGGLVESRVLEGDAEALEQARFEGVGERPLARVVLAGASEGRFREAFDAPGDGWRWRHVPGTLVDPSLDELAAQDWEWRPRALPDHVVLEREGPLDEPLLGRLCERLAVPVFAMALPGQGAPFATWQCAPPGPPLQGSGVGARACIEAWSGWAACLGVPAGAVTGPDRGPAAAAAPHRNG
jgi:hypothetical protein